MRMYRRYGASSWETPEGSQAQIDAQATATVAQQRSRAQQKSKTESRRQRAALPMVQLLGVELHAITEQRTVDFVLDELDAGSGGVVVTPNLDHLRRCTRDLSFNALVAEADLVVADGMPLIWASRLQGTPLPMRVAGSDLISSLSREAALKGRSIFLLGGAPGTAEAAAEVLKSANPQLKVVGAYC